MNKTFLATIRRFAFLITLILIGLILNILYPANWKNVIKITKPVGLYLSGHNDNTLGSSGTFIPHLEETILIVLKK
jgi:hypothetical protein